MWIYHSSCLHLSQTQGRCPRACPPQAMYLGEHRPEQLFGDRHFSHLEDGHPGVTDNLGANLYELELYAGERQVGSIPWEGEAAHEVTEVVCEHEQRESYTVKCEPGARQTSISTLRPETAVVLSEPATLTLRTLCGGVGGGTRTPHRIEGWINVR